MDYRWTPKIDEEDRKEKIKRSASSKGDTKFLYGLGQPLPPERTSGSTTPEFLNAVVEEVKADFERISARSAATPDGLGYRSPSNGNDNDSSPSALGEQKGGAGSSRNYRDYIDELTPKKAEETNRQKEARRKENYTYFSFPQYDESKRNRVYIDNIPSYRRK